MKEVMEKKSSKCLIFQPIIWHDFMWEHETGIVKSGLNVILFPHPLETYGLKFSICTIVAYLVDLFCSKVWFVKKSLPYFLMWDFKINLLSQWILKKKTVNDNYGLKIQKVLNFTVYLRKQVIGIIKFLVYIRSRQCQNRDIILIVYLQTIWLW